MDRKHRLGFSWLAFVLCMALLMTSVPLAPAYAKSKKETYYTIKWKVNGETVKKDKVKKGEKPEAPEDPADYTDGKYTYTFKGWEPKVTKATEDMTYKAKFKKSERTVTITWLDDEGKLIDFTQVKYGKVPTHEEPKKKASKKYTYEFDGWQPEPVKAKEEATYTATFKKSPRKYKITWLDDKGNVLDETKVGYGELPTHEDPVKKSGKYTYTFTGWQPALTEVTGDATYTATFEKGEKTAEKFTITWLDDAGNVIDATQVKAGKVPAHDAPAKASTEQYTYTFAGWQPEPVEATADATYTATFTQQTRQYRITWQDDEGNVIDETMVPYGETPTHEAPTLADTENYSYIFKGWTPEPAPVTGDATYIAVFDEIPKQPEAARYTITWLDDAGNVIDTTTAQAGEVPVHDGPAKADTEQYSYTFAGWWPEPVAATADATYTATYIQTEIVPEEVAPETEQPELAGEVNITVKWGYEGKEDTVLTGAVGSAVTEPDKPLREGFTFDHWADAGGNTIAFPTAYPETDMTITAVWAAMKTITVKWGYEVADTVLTGVPGSAVAEPEKPLREGFTFDHWVDAANNPIPFPTVYPTENMVITAVWTEAQTVTITLDWGYERADNALTGKVGTAVTAPDTTREGYTFAGWKLPEGVAAFPTVFTTDMTIKALWNVTIALNWGYERADNTISGVTDAAVTAPDTTREGFTLVGWQQADGTVTETFPIATFPSSNVAVAALWKKIVDKGAVDCYAYITSATDMEKALAEFLPKENHTLDDGKNTIELDWTKANVQYVDAKDNVAGDGMYTFTLDVPVTTDATSGTYTLEATRQLVVGPKTSETIGEAKEKSTDFQYRWTSFKKDEATAKITAWTGKETDAKNPAGLPVFVPVLVDDMTVTEIGDGVFQGKQISAITVPTGVTTIGKNAFLDCQNLTKVELPDTLTKVGTNIIMTSRDPLAYIALNVTLETTLAVADGSYTICHVPDKTKGETDYEGTGLTEPVTLTATKHLKDISVFSDLTANCDFTVEAGHAINVYSTMTMNGALTVSSVSDSVTEAGALNALGTMSISGALTNNGNVTVGDEETEEGALTCGSLTNSGTVTVNGTLVSSGAVNNSGVLTNTGTVNAVGLTNTGAITSGGTLYNEGSLTNSGAVDNVGALTNTGALTNSNTFTAGGTVICNGAVSNSGEIDVNGAMTCNDSLTNTAAIKVAGTLTLAGAANENRGSGAITVDKKGKLTVEANKQLTNTATVTNNGAVTARGQVITCAGTWTGADAKVEGSGLFVKTHVFEQKEQDGKLVNVCKYCGATETFTVVALEVTYNGPALTKEYDLTRNVFKKTSSGGYTYLVTAPKASDFKIAPVKGSSWIDGHKDVEINIASIKSVEQFSDAKVGNYNLKFTFGLKGNDAQYYTVQAVTIPAAITARPVEITPRAGLSKVYGTKDPAYPEGSWLSNDETSPLHQDLSGVPGYGVPVNTKDGKPALTVTNQAYLLEEAKLKGTKFFPNDGWLEREAGEDVGRYKITIGKMDFGSNFKTTLKDEVFTITAKNIGDAKVTVDAIPNQKYTGKAIEPTLTVRYGTMTLKKDTDYTVTFSNNTQVSTDSNKAKATLTGKGNYAGTKEITFTIIKTSDGSGSGSGSSGSGSGTSGSGSGSYDYDFDDEEEEETAETESEGPVGVLRLDDVEYGTILFGTDGKPRPFNMEEEEIEPEVTDEEEIEDFDESLVQADDEAEIELEEDAEGPTLPRRLIISPEPMKIPSMEADGEDETVLLEGTNRQRFEELHLRLTTSEVQALVNNNVAEIVYEIEQAQLVLPLAALNGTVPLPASPAKDDGEAVTLGDEGDADIEDELEIEDAFEVDDEGDPVGVDMDDVEIPVDDLEANPTMNVDGYDIIVEQADATGLSQREQALIADNVALMPAYRVRVQVIPEGSEPVETGELDEDDAPITVPVTQPLPEGSILADLVLKLQPDDSFIMAPEGVQVLHTSVELAGDDAQAPEDVQDPMALVANGDAAMTEAVFDEEDDPIRVIVTPVVDGMYVALAPADWDPTPYLDEEEVYDEDAESFDDEEEELEFEDEEEFEEI